MAIAYLLLGIEELLAGSVGPVGFLANELLPELPGLLPR